MERDIETELGARKQDWIVKHLSSTTARYSQVYPRGARFSRRPGAWAPLYRKTRNPACGFTRAAPRADRDGAMRIIMSAL
jgi:hypothetical protein